MKTLLFSLLTLMLNIFSCFAQNNNIILADFESSNYGSWIVTGTAFGAGPAQGKIGNQQDVFGYLGHGLVNTFNGGDGPIGTLTSPDFKIERKYITFYIGGGAHVGQTCINMLVDGKIAFSTTGAENERLELAEWDVSKLLGQTAKIQIVDKATGGWGHINVDQIFESDESSTAAFKEIENLRIWNRIWENKELLKDASFAIPLHFRFIPANRAAMNGGFESVNGTEKDILAAGYQCTIDVTPGLATELQITICGKEFIWNRETQMLNGQLVFPVQNGKIRFQVIADKSAIRFFSPDNKDYSLDCEVFKVLNPELKFRSLGAPSKLDRLEIYGLRSLILSPEESVLAAQADTDKRVFYQSKSYTVYGGSVVDSIYGSPAAYVPERNTIVSPTRVTESFRDDLDVWRPWLLGRVIDHQTIWHPNQNISRFPIIKTGWPTVDAACGVALDVLQRCGSGEFARNSNEIGLWEAGFFWGESSGFGIWLRDATNVALRAGNLIDNEVASRTLSSTAMGGIDNGVDGVAMPMIGLWDNYLVNGDSTTIRAVWDKLKVQIAKLDAQFNVSKGLINAAHSTSNDNFAEPEAGGFALGTEGYFMLAYRAMADMGRIMHESEVQIQTWKARVVLLTDNIRAKYWKESAGYFTTGPVGSTGYTNNNWESSGQEIAIWPRFNIATSAQRRSVLDKLPVVALNEFGVNVFPYRTETNHFCNAAWVAWSAGMAAAAGREGRLDILQQLIGQQVRNAVMNKTFYEVIDYKSGRAWRWPGQLWQATGFLSYFYYGVLGMEYNQDGLTFFPAVPESLANMEISNFKYRKATLNFVLKGWGTSGIVYLDGHKVQSIPTNLLGEHLVEIVMSGHTDIASVPSVAKLDLYPNPSKDVIHLSHAEHCKSFSIYDLQGRLIKMIADAKVDIDVADLEVGVYLIKGVGFDGEQVFRRFLKI